MRVIAGVVAGLAVTALILSLASIWGMTRGLRELRQAQADLGEEIRTLRASRLALASPGEEPLGRPATPSADPALERSRPGRAQGLSRPAGADALEERLRRSDPLSGAPDEADVDDEREALLARLDATSETPSDEVLDQLALFAGLGHEEARQALANALGDPDPGVRKQAVEALADIGDYEAVESLSELAEDPDSEVRKQVADELGAIGNPAAGEVLQSMLRDEAPEVVEETLKSLGKLQYQPALPDVERFSRSEDLEIAGAAGRALRAMGDEAGAENTIEYLARFLEDEEPEIRSTAVSQIGKLGGESALDLLEVALDDSDPKIRQKAHWYLAELGSEARP